jgi:acyl-CoA hydrolase
MVKMNFRTRKLVKHGDLNPNGTLFGGRLLEWIDEEVAIFVICQLETKRVVTKLISEINFMNPAKLNDVVEIGVEVVEFGTTSITVESIARIKDTKSEILRINKMVFVCIDENGTPSPHGRTKISI